MKKIFTLAFSLIIFSASAHRGYSELNLKLYDNSKFSVVLDNVAYNYFTSTYKFSDLEPGKHFITVTKFQQPNWWGSYSIPKTIFSGVISIPAAEKIFAMINYYGSYVMLAQTNILGPDDSYSDTGYDGNNNSGYVEPTIDNYSPCISPVNFMSLVSVINSATFESSKIQIAKQAVNTNYFTSQQVRQILKLFTFESSKLEIAKLAYSKTIDKQSYFVVDDAFTFESSIEELNKYILG